MAYDYREVRPAVYVGTYGKYNEGSIYGAWLYPGDYDSISEFFDACKNLHKDEPEGAREFMFQDKEYIPDSLYSECSFTDAEFAYCKAWDEADDADAFRVLAEELDERLAGVIFSFFLYRHPVDEGAAAIVPAFPLKNRSTKLRVSSFT